METIGKCYRNEQKIYVSPVETQYIVVSFIIQRSIRISFLRKLQRLPHYCFLPRHIVSSTRGRRMCDPSAENVVLFFHGQDAREGQVAKDTRGAGRRCHRPVRGGEGAEPQGIKQHLSSRSSLVLTPAEHHLYNGIFQDSGKFLPSASLSLFSNFHFQALNISMFLIFIKQHLFTTLK